MRHKILSDGAKELSYEIREIVKKGDQIRKQGMNIYWENIGDPVLKGEVPPAWIKKIVVKTAGEDSTFGYSPSKGLGETREYIARERNLEGGIKITADKPAPRRCFYIY